MNQEVIFVIGHVLQTSNITHYKISVTLSWTEKKQQKNSFAER